MTDKEKILKLKDGEEIYLNWFEEGGGIVRRSGDVFSLFESPQYGGAERHFEDYTKDNLDELLLEVYSWV